MAARKSPETPEEREARERRRRRKIRRAYGAVTIAAVVACAVLGVWCVTLADRVSGQQRQMQHDLCGVVAPFAATPVPRPDPSHPARAAQYAWHQRFVTLGNQFKCKEGQ